MVQQILLHTPKQLRTGCADTYATQPDSRSLVSFRKSNSTGMKQMMPQSISLFQNAVYRFLPVFVISDQRMPNVCQMSPNLMALAGDQLHLQQSIRICDLQRRKCSMNESCLLPASSGRRLCGYCHLISPGILLQITADYGSLLQGSCTNRPVELPYPALFYAAA